MLEKERKTEIIEQFRINDGDTGSAEVQVALFTARLKNLTEHLKLYPQDHHSRHALLKVIGKQRRFMAYLSRTKPEKHRLLSTKLGLRK